MVGVDYSMNELRECINMAVGYPLELLVLCVLCVLHVCVSCVLGVYWVYESLSYVISQPSKQYALPPLSVNQEKKDMGLIFYFENVLS